MKRKKLKIILSFVAIIPLLLFSYQGQTNGNGTTEQYTTNEMDGKNVSNEEEVSKFKVIQANAEDTKEINLTHSELINITNEFMDILVQDVDQNYKVKGINMFPFIIERKQMGYILFLQKPRRGLLKQNRIARIILGKIK